MTTLPAPTEPHKSHTTLSTMRGFGHAAAVRPGDGFEIIDRSDGFVELRFTEARSTKEIRIRLHKTGIPAVIAELQRLTYGAES